MSINLTKPLRLRNDGGAQLQIERGGIVKSLTLNASGNVELDGTLIPTALTTASATITGGSINGTTIGATTASTGAFTNLSYTGTLTGGTGVVNLGSGQFVKDAAGNVGIGVTPSAFGSSFRALELASGSLMADTGGSTLYINQNTFFSGSAFVYKATGFATRVEMVNGEHKWFTAPSGTAGNAISFTQAMTLTASGNLGIGKTAPLTKLHIADTAEMLFDCSASSSHIAIYRDATPTHAAAIGYNTPGQSLTNDLVFSTFVSPSWGERMRITSAGNVLVGTTSSQGTLTVNGNIAPVATPTTNWGLDFAPSTSSGTYVTIADNATYDLAVGSGIVYIFDNGGAGVGSFITYYGVVNIQFQNGTLYSSTADTADKINVYFNGVDRYRIQNKTGSSKNLFVSTIRTRTVS